MKKVKIITMIAIIYIGLICINTQVFAASKGKTINDTTRLREKASTSSSTVTLISINQEVDIISKEDDWYKVKYKLEGKTYSGYIRNDMLEIDEKETIKQEENKKEENITEKEETTEISTESEETVDNTQIIEVEEGNTAVLKSKVQVKILPLINSNTIGNINKKTEITIIEVIGNWSYIESEKYCGWVLTDELQEILIVEKDSDKQQEIKKEDKVVEKEIEKKEPEDKKEEKKDSETKVEEKQEEQEMYVSSQTVNLRKEANSSSAILKQLSRNTQVTVVEKVSNTWSKVKVDGIIGYISSTYLSEEKTKVTSRGSNTSRGENAEKDKKDEEKEVAKKEQEENKKEQPKKEESKTSETTKKEQSTSKETAKKEQSTSKETTKKETTSSKVTGKDIVKSANAYLGYKYVLGGASPKKGFDCSGLTSYVYSKNGYTISRTSGAQASNGKKVKKSELKEGDLVLFNNDANTKIGHVGIYVGGGNFIHAANPKKGVVITSLSNSYYAKRYVTARRIID